jgi:DNA-binding transcriptional regulator LsrR (DeoR family)
MAISNFVSRNLKLELITIVAKGMRVSESVKLERQLQEEEGLRLCGYVRYSRSIREYSSLRQARVLESILGSRLATKPRLK